MDRAEVMSHPHAHNRSLAEESLIQALKFIALHGSENERQLATLAADLIHLAGDQPAVKNYIDAQALRALDKTP
jgi:hypothetical protein